MVSSRIGITKVNSINVAPRRLPALTRLPLEGTLTHILEGTMEISPLIGTAASQAAEGGSQ
jgi:hypothetical protein